MFDLGSGEPGYRTLRTSMLSFSVRSPLGSQVVCQFLYSASVAPVSVIDQCLEEDPRVNCLEDSLILWTAICSSKLLAKTQLILFLNKCDLLRRKLKRGIKAKQ